VVDPILLTSNEGLQWSSGGQGTSSRLLTTSRFGGGEYDAHVAKEGGKEKRGSKR
jgi:hypothetical protein